MKTIEINLYKFDELPEEAQEKAIEKLADINVDYEWWDYIYEDAENIGCEIKSFDIYRNEIDFYCDSDHIEVAQNIISSHGEHCDTYKLAEKFVGDFMKVSENDVCDLEKEFQTDLSECYLSMIIQDYQYLTSRERIIETIKANDYDFTINGEIY